MDLPVLHPAIKHKPKVNILVWHDIVPDGKKIVWFDTTVEQWKRQLEQLASVYAHPISLSDLEQHLRDGIAVPPHSVVYCFDDNTRGIHDFAFPHLQKRGYPFVVSVHTAYIGRRTGKMHNDWKELETMTKHGAAIVSQTHTHPADLRTLSDRALADEFVRSRQILSGHLQRPVDTVTYPSGKWDNRVAALAYTAGYRFGLTEEHGAAEDSPHLLAINRWSTHRRFDEALTAIRTGT